MNRGNQPRCIRLNRLASYCIISVQCVIARVVWNPFFLCITVIIMLPSATATFSRIEVELSYEIKHQTDFLNKAMSKWNRILFTRNKYWLMFLANRRKTNSLIISYIHYMPNRNFWYFLNVISILLLLIFLVLLLIICFPLKFVFVYNKHVLTQVILLIMR